MKKSKKVSINKASQDFYDDVLSHWPDDLFTGVGVGLGEDGDGIIVVYLKKAQPDDFLFTYKYQGWPVCYQIIGEVIPRSE